MYVEHSTVLHRHRFIGEGRGADGADAGTEPLLKIGLDFLADHARQDQLPEKTASLGKTLAMFCKKFAPVLAGAMLVMWGLGRIKRHLQRDILDSHVGKEAVGQLSWRQFEGYVAEAFRREGYSVQETGDPAGDGGVDLVLRKDGQTTLVQCKHWKAYKVGVQPVRELLGVISSEGAQAGVMATSGRFTSEAWEFARANRIRLIDGDALEKLVQSIGPARTFDAPGKPSALQAAPTDRPASSSPMCPRCGQPMLMRTARRGVGAGDQFWGCKAYPRCKGTRPA